MLGAALELPTRSSARAGPAALTIMTGCAVSADSGTAVCLAVSLATRVWSLVVPIDELLFAFGVGDVLAAGAGTTQTCSVEAAQPIYIC